MRLGAVIVFDETVTRERAEIMLKAMQEAGVIDGKQWIGGLTPVQEFDPRLGGPVWYVP